MAEAYNLPVVGQLVRSIAGRDHGKFYLVYRVEGNRVLLVDGRSRLTGNPKVKNPCHLQKSSLVAEGFRLKAAEDKLTPEDIRAELNRLLQRDPDEEALDNV